MGKHLLAGFFIFYISFPANAETYVYPASCEGSYSKQGEQSDDLAETPGRPVNCSNATLSILENGRVVIQLIDNSSQVTPLGFSGAGYDYEINPNLAAIHLNRISIPHTNNPSNPQVMDGIEGVCFIDGKANLRNLHSLSCAAKIELGTQKLVYNINAKIQELGERVPGF